MARRRSQFSIAELESFLQDQRARSRSLEKDRQKLQKQIDVIDAELRAIGGGSAGRSGRGGARGGGRARNETSLVASIESALKENGSAMKVGDIVDAVERAGYRSKSANFRGIVNQTLLKESKKFGNVSRGMYQLKK